MNALEEYFGGIVDGSIVACDKMKRVSEHVLSQYADPGRFHFDQSIADRHTGFIERFCYLPAGRGGVPFKLELFQKARLEVIFGFVDDNDLRQYQEVLIIEGRKNGKALALDTEIPTPSGWTTMEHIRVGDLVYGSDGRPHRVTLTSETFIGHDCYRVTFEDGESVVCDADHLWAVKNKKQKVVVKRTSDLLHHKRLRRDGKGTEYLYRVQMPAPIDRPHAELPLDPYTLGVWLGDGTSVNTAVTSSRDDIEEMRSNVESFGHTTRRYDSGCRASSFGIDRGNRGARNKTLDALRSMGVLGNKHIPAAYLAASFQQRLELLQGLMDTDGTCSKAGQCEFVQANRPMVEQVRELLASLGIKANIRQKTTSCNGVVGAAYSMTFFTDLPVFRLSRKAARLKERLHKRMLWKSIVSIEPVPSVPCKCIAVDSSDRLYCFGRTYTLTHNTSETAAVEIDMTANDGEFAPETYNVATKREQAAKGFNAAWAMIHQSSELRKHFRKRADGGIHFAPNMGVIKALASNTNTLDSLDVSCGVVDELAAIKNRDLYDLIKQAGASRAQPLLFTISTNGFVRDNIFDAQYEYAKKWLYGQLEEQNDRFIAFVYELDDRDEWDKEECWVKANPGLGTIKSTEFLRNNVAKAKDDPSYKPTVMVKDFNMIENVASAWLSFSDIQNTERYDFASMGFRYGIGGFDAADSVDLNAAVAFCQRRLEDGTVDPKIYTRSMYWLPETVLEEANATGTRRERDNVPYLLWERKGLLRTYPGNRVDKRVFLDWFRELRDEDDLYVAYIGYDPWHIDISLLAQFAAEFGKHAMIPIRQGVRTMSDPLKSMKADFRANRFVHNSNPIDMWCMSNAEVRSDINGNIQLVKGIDARKRIDGLVAYANAYIVMQDKRDDYLNLI
jgi:phage terminase large subunit-like protein